MGQEFDEASAKSDGTARSECGLAFSGWQMTQPITSPFRYRDLPFATDPRFTGKWASKANHCNDLTPKPSKFSVAIATPAESARTNSIKRAK